MSAVGIIFGMIVGPSFGVVIIILNSFAIYKMVRTTRRMRQIDNDDSRGITSEATQTCPSETGTSEAKSTKSEEHRKGRMNIGNKNREIKFVIAKKNNRVSKCVILLVNLAISDLAVGVDLLVIRIMFFVYRGIENKILYYVIGVFKWCLMPMSLLMSVSNLMLVAVLRYYAAKRPFKHQSFTNGFITKICLLQWVLVTLFPIIKFSLSYRLNEEISEDPGIFLHIFIFLAATGLAATYVFIFRAIRSRKVVGESNSQSHGKTREKAFTVALFTVFAFAVCWLPYSGWKIYSMQTGNQNHQISPFFATFMFSNSIVNPIAYLIVFRKR